MLLVDKSHSVFRCMHLVALAGTILAYAVHQEQYAVITFDTNPAILKSIHEHSDPRETLDKILNLKSGGRTDLSAALTEAYKALMGTSNKEKILCLSDR